jgi:DNA-binding MarR family transcriptional regulator
LRKQDPTSRDTATALAELVRKGIPRASGLQAWRAFLRAHATLMRRLDSDLRARTGSGLNDFDVLGQLGDAGGFLRMTELAERAYSSRSGMTRRVDKLEAEGLLCRIAPDQDGRGVLVALTDDGVKRLEKLAAAHLRAVNELFVSRLDDRELAALTRMLNKVHVDASFG